MVKGAVVVLDYFVNEKYKVLECMFKRQILVGFEKVVKLSQQEIADILSFTKPKVNAIIADLKKDGYLIQHSSRGKYSLTQKANAELNKMGCQEVK